MFKNVIGQKETKQRLLGSLKAERVPHAQIILGPEGSGALSLALAYAQYLQCENPTYEDACGTCASCSKASKFIHPDIHFSFPTVESKLSTQLLPEWRKFLEENPYGNVNNWLNSLGAENKQGNIYAKECDDIIRKLNLKRFEGKYKILLLWLPEFLGNEGNRLLKVIEEPTDDTLFLLVAENQEQILNTILSRCQLVKVYPLEEEELSAALQAKHSISTEKARTISFLAEGNFNKAEAILEEGGENDDASLFIEWLRTCWGAQPGAMVHWVEKISGGLPVNGRKYGRKEQKNFLYYGLHFLRELAVLLGTADAERLRLLSAERESAVKMSKVMNLNHIEHIKDLLDECYYHIERNAHPKALFLSASVKISKILKAHR